MGFNEPIGAVESICIVAKYFPEGVMTFDKEGNLTYDINIEDFVTVEFDNDDVEALNTLGWRAHNQKITAVSKSA